MEIQKLFIIATPIGNLGDISLRAIETLKSVDIILCEDTRVTKKLLSHYDIATKTMSYHQHSDEKKVAQIKTLLETGNTIALVSDAGTPGISDPGNRLVEFLTHHIENISIIPIPGVSAVITALSISGFPTDKFMFMGFPPHKKGRNKYFEEIANAKYAVAFYESNHRILKTLTQLSDSLNSERPICICRELTKKFETIYRGTVGDIAHMNIKERGEFVVVISPH